MLELGISQAQAKFTKILNQATLIVDKKAHNKKAVILPYADYEKLLKRASIKKDKVEDGAFSKFIGILENDFTTNDIKYNEIIK